MRFSDREDVRSRADWATAAVISLCAALALALVSLTMLDVWSVAVAVLATAGGVAVVEALLALKPKLARGVNIAALIAVVIACVMRPGQLYDGLPLLCNRAFEMSAAQQAYLYDLFEVGLEASAALSALTVGLCFVLGCAVAVASALLMHGRAWGLFVVVVALFSLQAYLGVNAAPLASVAVIASCMAAAAMDAARNGGRPVGSWRGTASSVAAVIACACLVSVACWVAYPAALHQDNPSVRAVNEQVRDGVAGGESLASAIVGALEQGVSAGLAGGGESQSESPEASSDVAESAQSASLQRVSALTWWEIALIMLAVLIAVGIIAYVVKRALVRRRFRDASPAVALDALFRHLVRVLDLVGVKQGNRCFSQNRDRVRETCGGQVADGYEQAVVMWQRARYSTQGVGASDVDAMMMHMKQVKEGALASVGALRKVAVHLLCYNRN